MLEKESIQYKREGKQKARDAAAMWFLRLRENEVSEQDFSDWRSWLAEDKTHEQEFDKIVELWSACDKLEDLPWPSEKEIKSDGALIKSYWQQAVLTFFELSRPRQTLLASFLLMLIATTAYLYRVSGLQYEQSLLFETTVAEHRTVELVDGSVMVLGAKTNISVLYTSNTRFITLHQGEAYFEVFKDQDRPFVVTAGQRSIRAVGTAFNVNIGAERVSVTVVEGLVRIEPVIKEKVVSQLNHADLEINHTKTITSVSGGQGVVYDFEGVLESLPERETEAAISWQGGRLVFIDKPLDSVIADINRYSSREIIISDDGLDDLRYTGTVFQDEISGWLHALDRAFPVRIIELGDRDLVVIARRDF